MSERKGVKTVTIKIRKLGENKIAEYIYEIENDKVKTKTKLTVESNDINTINYLQEELLQRIATRHIYNPNFKLIKQTKNTVVFEVID